MVLVCLNKTSATQAAVRESGYFAINILGADQGDIAYRFATKSGSAKFEGVEVSAGRQQVPLVTEALAHIECRVVEAVTGGTHMVFLGEVEGAEAIQGTPLTYFRGKFGRFETELEEAAYRELRRLILDRKLPMGAPLDVDQLAQELNQERPRIFYALTKLSHDGLVARDLPTGYRISPLTVYASDQYDARCTIECGVAEQTIPVAGDEDLKECGVTSRRPLAPFRETVPTSPPSNVRTTRCTSTKSACRATRR
jgi:4-nitrophenol 2-monooxygenase / 4-nitrocatechol 4-monooxygenase, reductase component